MNILSALHITRFGDFSTASLFRLPYGQHGKRKYFNTSYIVIWVVDQFWCHCIQQTDYTGNKFRNDIFMGEMLFHEVWNKLFTICE